jgi:hypothetical protein
MTTEDVPGGISLDQLLPWMRSLDLRPFTPSPQPSGKTARPDGQHPRDRLRRAA